MARAASAESDLQARNYGKATVLAVVKSPLRPFPLWGGWAKGFS